MNMKNIAGTVAAVVTVLAVFGYVFTFGRAIENLGDRLDRNCRFLAIIEADTRYIIIVHTTGNGGANAFREIFRNSLRDTCG